MPSNDRATGNAVAVETGGAFVTMEELVAVEKGAAGSVVAVDKDGIADTLPEGPCVGTATAVSVPQPVKIKTNNSIIRKTAIFRMINSPKVSTRCQPCGMA